MLERMMFARMYQSNPQFRQLADSVRNMTPEQAFGERGLDYGNYRNYGIEQIRRMIGF